ncbi:MAG: GNAT family N-acetyltransferase [Patulibacter sp.]
MRRDARALDLPRRLRRPRACRRDRRHRRCLRGRSDGRVQAADGHRARGDGRRPARDAGAKVWLAKDGGEYLGACVVFAAYSTFAAKPRWNVHDLAVLPQARDRGVGRALLQAVIDEAGERDVCAVTLEVRKDNDRARHLYRSLGFGPGFAEMDFWELALGQD